MIELKPIETKQTFSLPLEKGTVEFTFNNNDVETERLQKISGDISLDESNSLHEIGKVVSGVVDSVFGKGKWEEVFNASGKSTKTSIYAIAKLLEAKKALDEKMFLEEIEGEYLD